MGEAPFVALSAEERAALIREQTAIVTLDREAAIAALPRLLPTAEDRERALAKVEWVTGPAAELGEKALAMLNRLRALLRPAGTEAASSPGARPRRRHAGACGGGGGVTMLAAASASAIPDGTAAEAIATCERILLTRREGPVDVAGALDEALVAALGTPPPAARAVSAARALARAADRHGQAFAPGGEPAHHDRHHQAEATLATCGA
ncbi:MAG: hypothetical protein NZM07_09605 [Elioraea sp.]|nr:hypothetical protein [Elioraea sp.]